MNLIILIVAGFCEVGFTYCLGRAKSVDGLPWWGWMAGFLVFTIISMGLLAKATQSLPIIQSYQPFKALFMTSVPNNRYMELLLSGKKRQNHIFSTNIISYTCFTKKGLSFEAM